MGINNRIETYKDGVLVDVSERPYTQEELNEMWLVEMQATDRDMPRWFEDFIDENSVVLAPGRTKNNYDDKKTIRGQKP